jgi:hypothetical protein
LVTDVGIAGIVVVALAVAGLVFWRIRAHRRAAQLEEPVEERSTTPV